MYKIMQFLMPSGTKLFTILPNEAEVLSKLDVLTRIASLMSK